MFRLGLGLEILDLAWLWAALSTLLVPSHDSPLVSLDTLGPEKMYVILLHDMFSTDSRFFKSRRSRDVLIPSSNHLASTLQPGM